MLTFSMLLCQEAFLLSKTKCTVLKHEMCHFHIQKMWQYQIQKDDHFNIVIRNWKVVWKVVWIKHLLRLNLPLFSSVQVLQSFPWPSGYLHGKKNPLHVKPSYDFLFPEDTTTRLPQHTSNVNTECAGKSEWSKQLYCLYVTSFLEHWYILISSFWY